MKKPFTAEYLRERLSYSPHTGEFVWRLGRRAGRFAGSYDGRGYMQISVDRHVCKAHRLAWLYVTGEWPEQLIDHINHKTDDNRFVNLRAASPRLNQENQIRAMATSTHGYLGVKARKDGRYEARICVKGIRLALGSYGSPAVAHEAYLRAKRRLHAGCTL